MSVQDSSSGDGRQDYLSKKVFINGQTVTLYSSNGQTWFSSPEEIPEVMARLDNTRILLNDPKGEAPALPPKATAAKYRMRGPKPRPILQQEGGPITGTPVQPISSSALEVKVSQDACEVVTRPTKAGEQPAVGARKTQPAKQYKKLVAPVSTGPKPLKTPKVAAGKAAAEPAKAKESDTKKAAPSKATPEVKAQKSKPLPKKQAIKKASAPKAAPKKASAKKAPAKKKVGSVRKKRS